MYIKTLYIQHSIYNIYYEDIHLWILLAMLKVFCGCANEVSCKIYYYGKES